MDIKIILIVLLLLALIVAAIAIFLLFNALKESRLTLNAARIAMNAKLALVKKEKIAFEKEVTSYWRNNIKEMHNHLNHVKYQDNFFQSEKVQALCYNYYQQSFFVRTLQTILSDLSAYRLSRSNVSQLTERLLEAYSSVIKNYDLEMYKSFTPNAYVSVAPHLLERLINYFIFTLFKDYKRGKKLTFEIKINKPWCEIEAFFVGRYENVSKKEIKNLSTINAAAPDKLRSLAMNLIVENMGGNLVSTQLNDYSMITISLPLAKADAQTESAYSIDYEEVQREVSVLNAMKAKATAKVDPSEAERQRDTRPVLLLFSRELALFDLMESRLGQLYRIEKYRILNTTTTAMDATECLGAVQHAKALMPDLIFVDQPREHRCEVLCQSLKNELLCSHIPLFLLLGEDADVQEHKTELERDSISTLSISMSKEELERLIYSQLIRQQKIKAAWQQYDLATTDAKQKAISEHVPHLDAVSHQFLATLENYLNQHFSDPALRVQDLADVFHLTELEFEQKINATTSHSGAEHLRWFRLMKARSLIAQGEPMIYLHGRLGYASQKALVRDFTDYFHLSPDDIAVEVET